MNNSEPVSRTTLRSIADAANAEKEHALVQKYTSCVHGIISENHKSLLRYARVGKTSTDCVSIAKCRETNELSVIICNNVVNAVMTNINRSPVDGTKPPTVEYYKDKDLITDFCFHW